MLQAYCKLIVALLAAGCVHGFVHAEIYYAPDTGTSTVDGRAGPVVAATGPRTTMICVQRRHSETKRLRPIPGRRDVRHSDSPFGARPHSTGPAIDGHDEREARPTAAFEL